MARGPKGGSSRKASTSSPSVARWDQASEIPLDAQEDFHAGRDKVLLDGANGDADSDDDIVGDRREVLGIDESDLGSDSDSQGGEFDEEEDEAGSEDGAKDSRQYKRLAKEKAAREAAQISDEEEVELSDEDSDDDTTRWGSNKKAYYNTNDLDKMDEDSEIDEEEARRLELAEVKKLQARSRKGMEDGDFGLGEADILGGAEEGGKGVKDRQKRRMELDGPTEGEDAAATIATSVPATDLPPTDPKARAELLANLQKISPETVALAGDYADSVDQLIRVESTLAEVQKTQPKHEALGMMHLHYQALYTYVTTLTFYFHLRASPRYASRPADLSQHPVMQRILKLKEGLSTMEDLGFSVPLDGDDVDIDEEEEDDAIEKHEVEEDLSHLFKSPATAAAMWPEQAGDEDEGEDEMDLGELEEDELAALMADNKENEERVRVAKDVPAKKINGDTPAKKEKKPKEKKIPKKAKTSAAPAPFAPLAGLLDADDSLDLSRRPTGSGKQKSQNGNNAIDPSGDSYGEATSLSTSDKEDKAAKKKSLRFYTGQIDAKEQRRDQAARDRMGGDNDLPYRDRDRSRQGVEQARASREGKLKSASETALDGEEWGDNDAKDWREVMGDSSKGKSKSDANANDDDDDDYYDLVSSGRKSAKRAKKDAHDQERDESRIILDDEVSAEPGSHRAVTRQIQTNRGLTPHRKSDRNQRVKKRKKYEKAQKKLSSTRAVYKGGQGALQGGYQGEASGINSSVAKSRRFAS
ncbi:unnamed protein product [Sympodiomycopsis kandeliae]